MPWACLHPGDFLPRPRPGFRVPAARLLLAQATAAGMSLTHEVRQVLLRLFLIHLERVHQLRREDLPGARVHLLLAGRQALLELTDREVADNLGELVDVAGLDLLAVVLEAP